MIYLILLLLYLIGSICLFLTWARIPKTRLWIYHKPRWPGSICFTLQRHRDLNSSGISLFTIIFLLFWPFYALAVLALFLWTEEKDIGATEDKTKSKSAYR